MSLPSIFNAFDLTLNVVEEAYKFDQNGEIPRIADIIRASQSLYSITARPTEAIVSTNLAVSAEPKEPTESMITGIISAVAMIDQQIASKKFRLIKTNEIAKAFAPLLVQAKLCSAEKAQAIVNMIEVVDMMSEEKENLPKYYELDIIITLLKTTQVCISDTKVNNMVRKCLQLCMLIKGKLNSYQVEQKLDSFDIADAAVDFLKLILISPELSDKMDILKSTLDLVKAVNSFRFSTEDRIGNITGKNTREIVGNEMEESNFSSSLSMAITDTLKLIQPLQDSSFSLDVNGIQRLMTIVVQLCTMLKNKQTSDPKIVLGSIVSLYKNINLIPERNPQDEKYIEFLDALSQYQDKLNGTNFEYKGLRYLLTKFASAVDNDDFIATVDGYFNFIDNIPMNCQVITKLEITTLVLSDEQKNSLTIKLDKDKQIIELS